jgi:hypothetical protein
MVTTSRKKQSKTAVTTDPIAENPEKPDFIDELEVHMRTRFAKQVKDFERAGECQVRVIGMRSPVDSLRQPGLLFNYCLPAKGTQELDPNRFRQWVFKLDLPEVTDIRQLEIHFESLISRLPGIRQTLIALHESLGQITTSTKQDAIAKLLEKHGEPLDDPSGMQFMLSPCYVLTVMYSRFSPRSKATTNGRIEQLIAGWVTDVERLKVTSGPKISRDFFATFDAVKSGCNVYKAGDGMQYVLLLTPNDNGESETFLLDCSVICALPTFDPKSRKEVDEIRWYCRLRTVVKKAVLGTDLSTFLFGVDSSYNPLGEQGKKDAITVVVAESIGSFDFT